jgi:hypothetical protein
VVIKLHPALRFGQLKNQLVIKGYHASENKSFIPNNSKPLHVGSIQQSTSLAKTMKKYNPEMDFFLYELQVKIDSLHPHFYDEDPERVWNYDVAAYSNRVEFPQGLKMGDNISLIVFNSEKNIVNLRSLGLVQ